MSKTRYRQRCDVGIIKAHMMRAAAACCLVAAVGLLSFKSTAPPATTFALVLRSRDPLLFASGAVKHYAECKNIEALRILRDDLVLWNLTKVHHELSNDQPLNHGYSMDKLKEVLEDAAVPTRFIDLIDAQSRSSAVLLVSDELWIECGDLASAFETWSQHEKAIVGTVPLAHVLRPDSGQNAWLDYKVTAGNDRQLEGGYSLVSLNGAFVHVDYLRRAVERRQALPARTRSVPADFDSADGCDEVWVNHLAAAIMMEPPIHVRVRFDNEQHTEFSAQSSVYLESMSRCLSRLAAQNAGNVGLRWTRRQVNVATTKHGADSDPIGKLGSSTSQNYAAETFPMVDFPNGHRRKYVLSSDRAAGVTVVLVIHTVPNEVASAVRHLHSRHDFIREAVIWNNKNETMNHHMFPYDISVRYVISPKNASVYARYLGCLLARYEICYFQHERTRPLFVAGLYAAFLMRPDVIVAASDPKHAVIARQNMTYFDPSAARLAGFADMDEGAMAHKDLVRQFVERMALYNSRSFHERAADADLYFTLSQPSPPMMLTHTTWTNNKPRLFPRPSRVGKALAFTFAFASANDPLQGFADPKSRRFKHFKAPCGKSRCAFATSVGSWPQPLTVDFGHNRTGLKPARYYSSLLERAHAKHPLPSDALPAPDSTLDHYLAVDGDLGTFWRPQLPAKPSFIGLELLEPTTIDGVKLWCQAKFEPTPTLQLGFYGHLGYQTAYCRANWTSDRDLHVLYYACPPMRVHRVRLLIDAINQRLAISEFAVQELGHLGESIRALSSAAPSESSELGDRSNPVAAVCDLGEIFYVMHRDAVEDYYRGESLAMLEEACELGKLCPGKVKLIYVGNTAQVSLQSLARIFAVAGSSCDLEKSVQFDVSPTQHDHPRPGGSLSETLLRARRQDVYEWWRARNFRPRVVFFDPADSPLLFVLRNTHDGSASTTFVARASALDDSVEESLALADATTVSQIMDYATQANGQKNWEQDRRITYGLRTMRGRPGLLETPSVPAIEEVIVLVTPATTALDMDMFNANALPVLQKRADVRLVNVTALVHQHQDQDKLASNRAKIASDSSENVKRPKWRTLKDVMYYVSIYPARAIWVLDASIGAAYFASFASVEAARFVAAPTAIPHWESRMLAWNATCEWTAEGFEGKARELLQGRFNASSSFSDGHLLRHDASHAIVEEWPIKRQMRPFAKAVDDLAAYVTELASQQEKKDEFNRPKYETV